MPEARTAQVGLECCSALFSLLDFSQSVVSQPLQGSFVRQESNGRDQFPWQLAQHQPSSQREGISFIGSWHSTSQTVNRKGSASLAARTTLALDGCTFCAVNLIIKGLPGKTRAHSEKDALDSTCCRSASSEAQLADPTLLASDFSSESTACSTAYTVHCMVGMHMLYNNHWLT